MPCNFMRGHNNRALWALIFSGAKRTIKSSENLCFLLIQHHTKPLCKCFSSSIIEYMNNAAMLSEGVKNKHIWICVSTKNLTQQSQKSKKLESESFFLKILNPCPRPFICKVIFTFFYKDAFLLTFWLMLGKWYNLTSMSISISLTTLNINILVQHCHCTGGRGRIRRDCKRA